MMIQGIIKLILFLLTDQDLRRLNGSQEILKMFFFDMAQGKLPRRDIRKGNTDG